ncbi:MAG: SagB family peptide dehydrogenase, partial [Acidobacteria bacterium]|nr:SagB family peptide dehydrogenase [Acidobacteriota bacterium]
LDAAWTYHNSTKHSYWSIRNNPHSLDWQNQPLAFKIYSSLSPLRLPRDLQPLERTAFSAISQPEVPAWADVVPDLRSLARLLYFSAGITKRKTYTGGEIFFRAASCTGALYEIELYLVCGKLPDLEPGVYHFGPADFALRKLRDGDYRGVLVRATAGEPALSRAPVIVICTGTYWRNAWKYQARTYRHFGWDNGTILAHLLAMSVSLNLPSRLVCGFVDSEVNRLLDLDTTHEVAYSMVALGRVPDPPPDPPSEIPPLGLETVSLSPTEVDYPAMRAMHEASSLETETEVAAWRGRTPAPRSPAPAGPTIRLQHGDGEPAEPLERIVLRRGSTRQFAREPIPFAPLSSLLLHSTRGIPADFLDPPGVQLNDIYVIVHAVESLTPGAYAFRRDEGALECLKEGEFRAEAGYLGLEQELPADASATILFLADLKPILERFGNRGYRAVQLESGILGGKMYLAAYGLGLGATGLTFYDDDVTKFFSPHAQGKSAIFHVAVGKSAKKANLKL